MVSEVLKVHWAGKRFDSAAARSSASTTLHSVISPRRRVRGPGLQGLVGRVPSRGAISGVGYGKAAESGTAVEVISMARRPVDGRVGCGVKFIVASEDI